MTTFVAHSTKVKAFHSSWGIDSVKRTEIWQIKLQAEPKLLEQLSGEFCNPDLRLFQDCDFWLLESLRLDSKDYAEIYAEGERLIGFLNQTLWLYAFRLNPIHSDGYYFLTSSEERDYKFHAIGQAIAPTRLIVISNEILEETPRKKTFDLLIKDEKVSEAFALFNNPELDWGTLYKIYETVRDDKPDNSTSTDYKDLIGPEWSRFRDSANYLYRHSMSRKKAKKPDNPMSLSEAKQFIRKTLIAWLEAKTESKFQHNSFE